jgi:hypothetical protein
VEVLGSVFVEEMLHLTLAANLLNAVGGRPRFDIPAMMPGYPRCMPHGDRSVEMSLLPFGPDALRQFLRVERPAGADAPPEDEGYETIGQFYAAIRRALPALCGELGEATVFCGDPSRQVTPSFAYGGSGRIIAVHDLASGLAALDEIVEQGEGASTVDVWDGDREMCHPERNEVAHYYRIHELAEGRRYRHGDTPTSGPTGDPLDLDLDGIRPLEPNQRISDRPVGHPVRAAQEAFNRTYCALLARLDRAFDGEPEALGEAVGVMYRLKAQALALGELPAEDGRGVPGPTFEYVRPEHR